MSTANGKQETKPKRAGKGPGVARGSGPGLGAARGARPTRAQKEAMRKVVERSGVKVTRKQIEAIWAEWDRA